MTKTSVKYKLYANDEMKIKNYIFTEMIEYKLEMKEVYLNGNKWHNDGDIT